MSTSVWWTHAGLSERQWVDVVNRSHTTKLSGGANERQYCTQAGAPHDRMPRYAEFKAKFERQFGKIVVFAPYSYDATMLIADAMRRANSVDPKVYVNALATSRYTGITGEISFSPTGDNINGTVAVYQIKNGNLVPVSNSN
ncbi:ABC transporter substrate-binding protein [Burkholderia pseudomallei]|uniref:ABC transporter substrate-binding protein n=1 Tax=Burkholderia pseudomallei TaxID=28450 RepID=UPI0035C9240C